MPEAIFGAMGEILTRWTMGSAAAPAASIWRAELGTEPAEAELRLLALASQFLDVAVTVEPPAALRVLPELPVLALPIVPEALRPLVRRLLTSNELSGETELLGFLAARGWTAHPSDWMPALSDEPPDVYAPWCDWAAMAASSSGPRQKAKDQLSLENWEDFGPAARKVALAELRRRDPSAARVLLETKLVDEAADTRLRLLAVLSTELSDDDAPFLERIVGSDRAPKVKAFATSLLARLGRGPPIDEATSEITEFFSVKTKGLLRRVRVIEFANANSPAQRQRRAAVFERVDLASFARGLALAPHELIEAWSWDVDQQADATMLALIAQTGTDEQVALTAQAISLRDASGLLAALAPRLTQELRSELAENVLRKRGLSFDRVKAIGAGTARLDNPLSAPAGAALLAALKRDDAKPSEQFAELFALGLIASRPGARQALERLYGIGMLQGDPRLDMLRLNAALDDNGAMQ